MPILIEERSGFRILAQGSHADLSKLVKLKRAGGKWTGPVRIVRDDARLLTDDEYYRGMTVTPINADEQHQARFILDAMHQGVTSFDMIAHRLCLPRSRVVSLTRKYKLRWTHWQGKKGNQIVDAETATEMAHKLGRAPYLVRNASRNGQLVNGFKICKYYEFKASVNAERSD
ncbi:hypothetical protein [Lactiplantibacillus paraxiangfangensis]|uniref:hypothetical protein n=1 Tax=Lactiplantibacillus paraxiangfangensis TaxID=3076224 RepID=UPI0030C6CF2E